jgi:hypothetical protein
MMTSELTIQPIARPDEAIKAWNQIYSDDEPSETIAYLAIQLALGMVLNDSVREAMEKGPLRGVRPVRGFVYKLARLSDRLAENRLVDIIKSDHEVAEFLVRHPAAVVSLKRQELESEGRKLTLASAAAPAKRQAASTIPPTDQVGRDVAARLVLARWLHRAALIFVSAGLGLIAGRQLAPTQDPAGPMGELLSASLTPVPGQDRSDRLNEISVTSDGSFTIHPGTPYSLIIRSPRAGAATIVIISAGQTIIYPKNGQDPIGVEAGMKPQPYGPLTAPLSKSTAIVVITDQDATATIGAIVERQSTAPGEPLEGRIRDELSRAGRPWVAIERVSIEPPSQPELNP